MPRSRNSAPFSRPSPKKARTGSSMRAPSAVILVVGVVVGLAHAGEYLQTLKEGSWVCTTPETYDLAIAEARKPNSNLEDLKERFVAEQRGVFRPHEALPDGVAEHPLEPVPVALDVEDADGLPVDPELRPRQDLERLFEGAEAAGKRDEPVGEPGHRRLPFVHRAHHPELREPGVGELARGEWSRNHADHLAALGEDRVGEHAHEAHRAAAVDEPEPARRSE